MPLTAEQQKAATRKLKVWLENDRQIVTFRQVSREIGCHVDLAKKYVKLPNSNATLYTSQIMGIARMKGLRHR